MRLLARSFCTVLIAFALASAARAQEPEPNSVCAAAQRVGSVGVPGAFQGSLDALGFGTDVDFLVFAATPGDALTVALESGGGLLLGSFDARSRGALGSSEVYPFALFVLQRCEGGVCTQVSARPLDVDGRTRIERDGTSQRIVPGTFQLVVLADHCEIASSDLFAVAEGQHIDVGDIAVEPPAIGLTEVQACTNLQPQGGTCRYSVRIRNDSDRPLSGLVRSLGMVSPFTAFEASTQPGDRGARRARVTLDPSESTRVAFSIALPPSAPEGTLLCPFVELGLDPAPLFDSARSARLFCIVKSGPAFRVLSAEEPTSALAAAFEGRLEHNGQAR